MKINKKKIICIIPARGGSKRIKNKNIKKFNDKPLIFYSIHNALKSKIFSDTYVSTDSNNIKKAALKYGAKVPFLRPKEISDDKTIVKDVMKYFLKKLPKDDKIDYFCCLYPTAPLINSDDLKKAFKEFLKKDADALISVAKYNNHPLRSLKVIKKKYIDFKFPKFQRKNSQDLEILYRDAGAFYFYKINKFMKLKKKLMPKKTIPYILEQKKVVDIDDYDDFNLAVKMFRIK